MRCCVCGRGPMHGTTVHRLNEKGQPGVWVCEQHWTGEPDEAVKLIERALTRAEGEGE